MPNQTTERSGTAERSASADRNPRTIGGSSRRSPALERELESFAEEHPLLTLGFVVAAGYALGRIVSKL